MTFEYEKTSPVRWPHRRHSLVWYLYQLADPQFQQDKWIDGQPDGTGNLYGFSFVVHFFFDDTDLAEHPETTLGDILLDELEVSAVGDVGCTLSQVYDQVGPGKADLDYISFPSWQKVVDSAHKAYRLMRSRLLAEGDSLLPPELPM